MQIRSTFALYAPLANAASSNFIFYITFLFNILKQIYNTNLQGI